MGRGRGTRQRGAILSRTVGTGRAGQQENDEVNPRISRPDAV